MNYADFFRANISKFKMHQSGQATGLCPVHDDRHPSFSCNVEDGLWKCHGCEKSGNVFQLAKHLGVEPPEEKDRIGKVSYPLEEIARYTYEDQNGKPILQVRRYLPKTFRQFHYERGEWVPGLNGTNPVLYKLPQILNSEIVYIVEGEKDVETLWGLGLPATCNPMGAGKWREEYSGFLKGKSIVIIPDQDEVGKNHGNDVARKIWNCAKAIKIVHLPKRKDISEWVALGGTKEELSALVRATPVLDKLSNPFDATSTDKTSEIELIQGSQVMLEPYHWLWDGWLASGKMHLLAGSPGSGKTTIAMSLAAKLTTGGCWPDGSISPKGSVLIWSGEDDFSDTLAPRLLAVGADLERVYFIKGVTSGDKRRAFDPALDLELLKIKLKGIDDIKMLIVDPIANAVSADSNKNCETRRALQPLVDLAADLNLALLGITHFSKGTAGRHPTERVTGSLAFAALARIILVTVKPEVSNDDQIPSRLLLRSKSNIGIDEGGFKYSLIQNELDSHPGVFASSVLWGESVEGSTRDLLNEAEGLEKQDREEGALAGAKYFLKNVLWKGPLPQRAIEAKAEAANIAFGTVKRAKKELGVISDKNGMDGGWNWRLPEDGQTEGPKGRKESEEAHQHLNMSPFGDGCAPSEQKDRERDPKGIKTPEEAHHKNMSLFGDSCSPSGEKVPKEPKTPEDAQGAYLQKQGIFGGEGHLREQETPDPPPTSQHHPAPFKSEGPVILDDLTNVSRKKKPVGEIDINSILGLKEVPSPSSEEDQTVAEALEAFPGAKVVYRGPVGGWEGPK